MILLPVNITEEEFTKFKNDYHDHHWLPPESINPMIVTKLVQALFRYEGGFNDRENTQ